MSETERRKLVTINTILKSAKGGDAKVDRGAYIHTGDMLFTP
jgi:hypothetical protein